MSTLTAPPAQNSRLEIPPVPAPTMNGNHHGTRTLPETAKPVTEPPPVPAKRRNPAVTALVVLAVIVVTGFGYYWLKVGRFIESTDDSYVGGDVTVIAPKVPGFIQQ